MDDDKGYDRGHHDDRKRDDHERKHDDGRHDDHGRKHDDHGRKHDDHGREHDGHGRHDDASQNAHVEDASQRVEQDVTQWVAATQDVAGNLSIDVYGEFKPYSEVDIKIDDSSFSANVNAYNSASNYNSAYNSVSVSTTTSDYGGGHDGTWQYVRVDDVRQSVDQDVSQAADATQEVAGNVSIEVYGVFYPYSEVNITIEDSDFDSTVYASNNAYNSNNASDNLSVYTNSYDAW